MGSPQHRKTRESISKKIMASLPDFDLLSPSLARSPYPLSQSHSPPLSLSLSFYLCLSINLLPMFELATTSLRHTGK